MLKDTLLLVLLEIDSERNANELEIWIKQHLQEMVQAYQKKQAEQLRKLLGDEDLIALEVIPVSKLYLPSPKEFTFRGIHLFDEYQ